jgi:hypothetical protein
MKSQKGLSTLVIVIIIAVIIAVLLIITYLGREQAESIDELLTPDTGEIDIDTEILDTEPILVPLENLPPEWLEWLEITYPDLVEHYSEGGIPMDLLWELERVMQEGGEISE